MSPESTIRILALAVLLVVSVDLSAGSEEVMGCGGFIRSKKPIDVSRIQMELFSKRSNSLRKVSGTDCAPMNGYYFMPVYEHGDYVLKPNVPHGWQVQPEQMDLTIDGETDACSKNEDLNFEFVGFGITGWVLSQGSRTGPQGIDVELFAQGQEDQVLASATTSHDGSFVFYSLLPGKYGARISAKDVNRYTFDSLRRDVVVDEDVGVCQPFQILGFEVTGSIETVDRLPLANMAISLFSPEGKLLGQHSSDASGRFRFSKVANGEYSLKLSQSVKGLTVEPMLAQVKVSHDNAKPVTFVATSFTVTGKVMTSATSGNAFAGIQLRVISHDTKGPEEKSQVITTSSDGSFEVQHIQKGPVTIQAEAAGYHFEAVTLQEVSPLANFPPIYPSKYLVEGHVEKDSMPQDFEATIQFEQLAKAKGAVQHAQTVSTKNGLFSIFLAPGHYRASVQLPESTIRTVGFAPLHHEFSVSDSTVSGITFKPIKANLEGTVQCLEASCGSTKVFLNEELSAEVDAKGHFQFLNIFPGKYRVSVSDSRFCWQHTSHEVAVSQDVKDVVFKQIGRYLTVHSLRSTDLIIKSASPNPSADQRVRLSQGENRICLTHQHTVQFSTEGCEIFDIEPSVLEPSQITSDTRIQLKPIKFLVSGGITSAQPIPDLRLHVKSDVQAMDVVPTKTKEGYSFQLHALAGEDLSFAPHSERFLFEPESLHIFVDRECHLNEVKFEAKAGYFVVGEVVPAVAEVSITLINPPANVKTVSTVTDDQGRYQIGPLPSHTNYQVQAAKPGYEFEPMPGNGLSFRAKKLASISVQVMDGSQPLTGAVVTISGAGDYRANTHTKPGGQAHFGSLLAGQYYVKPQLKEYEFAPKHELLQLNEGETKKVLFQGKRVAFSLFGKVRSLNGEPEVGVVLRAKVVGPDSCEAHSTEEASSESVDGAFRFRGLQPGCEYAIQLANDKGSFETILPQQTRVLMKEADANVTADLMAIRSFSYMDTTIKVMDSEQPPALYRISVTSEPNFSFSTKALAGQLVVLPTVLKDDQRRYQVTADKLLVTTDKYAVNKRASVSFKADQHFKFVEMVPEKVQRFTKTGRKISLVFYLLLLLLLPLSCYLLWDYLPASFRTWCSRLLAAMPAFGYASSSASAAMPDDSWIQSLSKRKHKKKTDGR